MFDDDHATDSHTGLPVVTGFIQYPAGHKPGPGNPIEPRRAMRLTCISDNVPGIECGATIRVETVELGIVNYTVSDADPQRKNVRPLGRQYVNDANFRRVMT